MRYLLEKTRKVGFWFRKHTFYLSFKERIVALLGKNRWRYRKVLRSEAHLHFIPHLDGWRANSVVFSNSNVDEYWRPQHNGIAVSITMGCDAMWPSQTQNSSFANIVLIVQLQHSTNTSNMKVSMCNKIVFTTIIIATVNAQSGLRTLKQDVSCALFNQSVMVLRTHWNFANLVPNLLYTYIHIALCLSHDEQIRQVQWG